MGVQADPPLVPDDDGKCLSIQNWQQCEWLVLAGCPACESERLRDSASTQLSKDSSGVKAKLLHGVSHAPRPCVHVVLQLPEGSPHVFP